MRPEVSVIIPCYNAGKFIARTIRSVTGQSYTNWELIIIDDGSGDDSAAIIRPFLDNPKIRYIYQENAGVSNARNHGLAEATGDFICFLDADDLFLPENLLKKAEVLRNKPEIGLVHSDLQRIGMEDELLPGREAGMEGTDLHYAILSWERCVITVPSSIMVRRSIFKETGEWDPEFTTAADQDLMIRIAARYPIARIPEMLTGYRIVPGSMGKQAAVFEKDHLAVYRKAERLQLFQNSRHRKRSFAKLHLIIAGMWWQAGKPFKTVKHLVRSILFSVRPIWAAVSSKITGR